MKKLIKSKSSKGFTLVETVLAIFILLVVSTMLINGFVTTMAYSYQTSVYSKSAGNNYKACINQVATWSHYKNTGDSDTREHHGQNYIDSGNNHVLKFAVTTTNSFEDLSVAVEKNSNLGYTVPNTLSYNSYQYAPTNDSYSDNRTYFVYYPEWCSDESGNRTGEIVVMYKQTENEYYWVVSNGTKNLVGAPRVGNAIHSS